MRPIREPCVLFSIVAVCACGPRRLPPAPDANAAPLTAVRDSAVIARGRYLVTGPAHCVACHSPDGPFAEVDPANPPVMSGGFTFRITGGTVHTPNLTSDPETGIGRRTDAELVAALRHGLKPDGSALLPFMEYRGMSDDDVVAVLSYLRALPPVRSEIRVRQLNVIARVMVGLFVKPVSPASEPPRRSPKGVSIERGRYLTESVAACAACHTRRTRTGGYAGVKLSGGMNTPDEADPTRELITPNLTPDPETGYITGWTENEFVARFRRGRLIAGSHMPWSSFARMSEADLRSIYRYLMSLPPTRNHTGPVVRPKYRPAATLNLLLAESSFDFEGTGTAVAVAGHLTWQWKPALAIEPGITYFAHDATSTLLFPELSLQAGLPRGLVRPYIGGGVGLTIPASGGGGTHRSLHAVLGVRLPVMQERWTLRGEVRLRSPEQWRSTTTDHAIGLGWRFRR